MKEISLFRLILEQTKTTKFLLSFIPVFLICTLLIWWTDPDMSSWWDAVWYGFMLVTTIGFGDLTVTSLPARLISVFLGLYGIVMIGFVCGVGASWLFEKVRASRNESVSVMIWQLEHLDSLSDRQISDLQSRSAKIAQDRIHQQSGKDVLE